MKCQNMFSGKIGKIFEYVVCNGDSLQEMSTGSNPVFLKQ